MIVVGNLIPYAFSLMEARESRSASSLGYAAAGLGSVPISDRSIAIFAVKKKKDRGGPRLWAFATTALMVLSGCAAPVTRMDASLVQVPAIIGALKCAFATALLKEKRTMRIKRLENTVASGTLTLNVVHKVSLDASVTAKPAIGGPFVFSYLGGTGSLLPRFSHSNVATNTIKTEIDFRYYMWADDDDVCDNVPEEVKAKYGFSQWLATVISGLDDNSYQYPFGQADALKYESEFGVVAKDSAGLDFDVVFLSGSLGAENERTDVQKLKFTIAAASKDNPPPDIWSENNGQSGRNR